MRKELITNHNLWFIIFLLRSIIFASALPVVTTGNAEQDAWISVLVVLAGSLLFAFLICLLDTKFPKQTIVEYSQQLLGPWLGKIISLVLVLFFLFIAVIELRLYAGLIITVFLPNTPIEAIIFIMALLPIIAVYMGLETIARTSDLLFFFFLFMILGVIIIPGPNVNLQNLQPVFTRGWSPIFSGAIVPIALINQIWVVGILSPAVKSAQTIKVVLTSIFSSLLILLLVVIITIGVLSAEKASRVNFPLSALMRSVQLGTILERTEVLIFFLWGFALYISISIYLYSFVKGFSQLFKSEDYRSLTLPTLIIFSFLTIYSFEDIFMVNKFLSAEIFGVLGIALLIITLAVLWLAYALKYFTKNF